MMSIEQAALDLAAATSLGASIGFERQWRLRVAGLRTNTLVAIGAASLVIFANLVPAKPQAGVSSRWLNDPAIDLSSMSNTNTDRTRFR